MNAKSPDPKFKNRVKEMLNAKIGGYSLNDRQSRTKMLYGSSGLPFPKSNHLPAVNLTRNLKGVVKEEPTNTNDGTPSDKVRPRKRRRRKDTRKLKRNGNLNIDVSQREEPPSAVAEFVEQPIILESISDKFESRNRIRDLDADFDVTEIIDDVRKRRKVFGEPTIFVASPSQSRVGYPITGRTATNSSKDRVTVPLKDDVLRNFLVKDVKRSTSVVVGSVPLIDIDRSKRKLTRPGLETSSVVVPLNRSTIDDSFEFESDDENADEVADNESVTGTTEDALDPNCSSTLDRLDSIYKPKFCTLDNKSIIIMSPQCVFYFNGKIRAKFLAGRVEIYGYVFGPDSPSSEIYSPRGSSLVSVRTVTCESLETVSGTQLYQRLVAEGINNTIATHLQEEYDRGPLGQAVVIFEKLENTLTKFLDAYCPLKLFPNTEDPATYQNAHPRKAEKILRINFQFKPLGLQLRRESRWMNGIPQTLLNEELPPVAKRTVIAGGKGVGKSTTLRYLVNGLLPHKKEVIVVDLDPGQPEFTPPGCLSINLISKPLTGPSFTHLKTPFYQVYIGDVNVVRCIPTYVKAVKKIVDFLFNSERLRGLNVFVNTMGFCTGIGWDLMLYVIKLIGPTIVIQILSEQKKNNFKHILSSDVVNQQKPSRFISREELSMWETPLDYEIHLVDSLVGITARYGDFWEMEPRQQRDLALLAYLSRIIEETDDGRTGFSSSTLPRINDVQPYAVPTSAMTIVIARNVVPPSHILATINCTVVALCGMDLTDQDDDSRVDASQPRTLSRLPICACYGFGIVRGVDVDSGKIYLNSPLSSDQLKFVDCLVGIIPVPTTLLSTNHRDTPYMHFGASNDELPTSREPRRGYFHMRRRKNA